MQHSPFHETTKSPKLHKANPPSHSFNQEFDREIYYDDIERYGFISDALGKTIGLTESTVKTLAKATADNLVIPVGSYIATKIVVPVGEHIATEIVLPVGKYVATEIALPVGKYVAKDIALPVGKYVAKEIALPIAKEVSAEMKDITTELMKNLTEQIKAAVKQEMNAMQDKIREMPNKIMEGIKSSIKLPWSAPTMETSDEAYSLDSYIQPNEEIWL